MLDRSYFEGSYFRAAQTQTVDGGGVLQLNARHKVGVFLTIVVVGTGLLLDVSAKGAVGIGMLGLAATWLLGGLRLRKQPSSHRTEQQSPQAPPASAASDPAPAAGEGQRQKPVTLAKSRHPWAWVILSVAGFSLLLSVSIFNLTWQEVGGQVVQPLGGSLVGLIALGAAARSAWKSLLAKEPEDYAVFRRRHQKFNVIGAICAFAMMLSALGFGITAGQRIQRNKRLDSVTAEIERLGPKGAKLREQMKAVLSEDTRTFEAYYLRSLELDKVLDEYDQQQEHLHTLLNTFLAEAADQPKLVEVAETARTLQRINAKDAEVVKVFRLQIAKSKELIGLPPSRQPGFYRNEIVPLEREAKRVGEEEIAMMREAEQKGIKIEWPSEVKELLR
jgi:hypothetical protein